MRRRRSNSVIERDKLLLEEIRGIKAEHPFWGYRRIWAYLKYIKGKRIGKNRVYRVMKENNLLVSKNLKNRAKRTPMRSKPNAKRLNHIWGTDMTKIKLKHWGWIYLVVVLDWYNKEIIGYNLSLSAKTEQWIEALNMAINNRFPDGIREEIEKGKKLYLVSDDGCQPTSKRYMRECRELGIEQIFTSWSNQGNADTERVLRTMKEDLVWIREWEDVFEFEAGLKEWVRKYNNEYPHQGLNYKTPMQCYEESIKGQTKVEVKMV